MRRVVIDTVILHGPRDAALASRIVRMLAEASHLARCLLDTAASAADAAPVTGRPAQLTLLLWTQASTESAELQRFAQASRGQRLIEITVSGAVPPGGFGAGRPVELDGDDMSALLTAVIVLKRRMSGPQRFLARSRFGGLSESAPEVQPVLLAASAPRGCTAGSSFTACLVAYVEAARESALRRLEQFGEAGDRVVSDLAPDGDARWRVGAPVTVRAAGPHLSVTPAERSFAWNGRENAAAFAIGVDSAAPAGSVELCFAVELAGVPIAFIPMRIVIGRASAVAEPAAPPAEVKVPRSVFASYSSKDAQAVTGRLSTLLRWSPGLDIFQDCLDLVPDEAFKPQLAAQIRKRDAFVLFWSRHAAASPWVRWEYETALETAREGKGLTAILPMPLEDPAIAPPPAEFADAHWRDRFMLAGYALAKIREEAGKP